MRALLTAALLCLMPLGCVVDPLPTPGTATDYKGNDQGAEQGGRPPDSAADAAVNTPNDATPTDDASGSGTGADGADVAKPDGDGA